MTMNPYILDETDDYAVVFKPPKMHCAPSRANIGDTLLDWYAAIFPPVMEISSRKEGEGGLVHRLDYETRGLVLFAKNRPTLEHLINQQNEGNFQKEYAATCLLPKKLPPSSFLPPTSFPPPPFDLAHNDLSQTPFVIESYFRPYGPGRKQVRPVVNPGKKETASDKGDYYRTTINGFSATDGNYIFTAKLCRGFRHQIRCHLAWIGCPVLNDPLYGEETDGFLGLCATGLFFTSPNGEKREYRIT